MVDAMDCMADGGRSVDGIYTIGMFLTLVKADTNVGYLGISIEDEDRDPNYFALAYLKTRQRYGGLLESSTTSSTYKCVCDCRSKGGGEERERLHVYTPILMHDGVPPEYICASYLLVVSMMMWIPFPFSVGIKSIPTVGVSGGSSDDVVGLGSCCLNDTPLIVVNSKGSATNHVIVPFKGKP
eukprot:Gb_03627 [translate_table: standard]